jgi:exosortase/archaeosortase family protein
LLRFPVDFITEYGSPIISLTRANREVLLFAVDTACSGLYSLIGLLIFATFSAYISKGSLLRKIIVFILGFPIIYFLNILRIFLLIIIGYFAGVELALNVFHLLGGWVLLFSGTIIILTMADRVFNIEIFSREIENCSHNHIESEGRYCIECGKILKNTSKSITNVDALKFLAITIAVLYFLTIQVPVFSLTSGQAGVFIKNPSGEDTTRNVLPEIEGRELYFVYRDTEFEKISGQNASLMYQYKPVNDDGPIVWVGIEISPIKFNMHQWETCLITVPEMQGRVAKNVKVDLRDIHLLENPPLSARYFAFHRVGSNLTEVILYWYTQSEFITEKGYETMWTKISVIQYADKPEHYRVTENAILPVARNIAEFWQPISTWSGMGIAIAKKGVSLMVLTIMLISVVVLYGVLLNIESKKKGREIYNQIIEHEDHMVLKSLKSSNNKPMKEDEILKKYREITGKYMDIYLLNSKLKKAEEIGLVKNLIHNENDKPYVKWVTNF